MTPYPLSRSVHHLPVSNMAAEKPKAVQIFKKSIQTQYFLDSMQARVYIPTASVGLLPCIFESVGEPIWH